MICDKCGFEHNSKSVCPKCGARVIYVNEDYLRRKEEWEKAQKAGSKLQEEFANALISFKENAITPVVNELAKEKGFSAIVDARTAFYMDDKLDVTKQAIERVNKKMPKIDIKKVSLEPAKKAKK